MDPEMGGGGGLTGTRILGVPVLVWVAGIAVLAYLYFRSSGSSSPTGVTTSGGGGSISTGRTVLDKGAVQVSITQNPQPKPPVWPRRPGHHGHAKHPGSPYTLHATNKGKGPPKDVIGPLHKLKKGVKPKPKKKK